jgi:NitT/TauT family transport system substrate-binding protein
MIGFARFAVLALAAALGACGETAPANGRKLRVGRFPNVTHAQGLIANGMTREHKGWFEERLGPDVEIEWHAYKAGPNAMEALLAGSLDLTYVGPSPALNAHAKSGGAEVFVIAGAARGGAALVVQGDGRIRTAADFRGKTVATPQLGNTQDVACRAWLAKQGFRVTQTGGDVNVVPTANSDQLALFVKGDLDAVWTVEPWVSRLEREGKGAVFLEEKDAVTTVLVASARFLAQQPQIAKRFAEAHQELTAWIAANPAEAQQRVRAEILAEMRQQIAPELLERCWSRLRFDAAVAPGEFDEFVRAAKGVGFLRDAGDLSGFVRVP